MNSSTQSHLSKSIFQTLELQNYKALLQLGIPLTLVPALFFVFKEQSQITWASSLLLMYGFTIYQRAKNLRLNRWSDLPRLMLTAALFVLFVSAMPNSASLLFFLLLPLFYLYRELKLSTPFLKWSTWVLFLAASLILDLLLPFYPRITQVEWAQQVFPYLVHRDFTNDRTLVWLAQILTVTQFVVATKKLQSLFK